MFNANVMSLTEGFGRRLLASMTAALGLVAGQAWAGPGEGHAHPEKGPHKGALIELGDEEYHAEIIHDEKAHAVTIYLLDGAAQKPVAISGKEVLINLKAGGKPRQYKLPAVPETGDPAGSSSRFVLKDAGLCHSLDEHGADPRLRVTINGKSYSGKIAHDHSHHH